MTNTFSINLKAQPVEEIQARSLTGLEAFEFQKLKNLERVVAVKVNGELRDLSSPIETEVELEPPCLALKTKLDTKQAQENFICTLEKVAKTIAAIVVVVGKPK